MQKESTGYQTMKRDVVLTGMGVLSSIGITCDEYWNGLIEGKSGIAPLNSLETSMAERPIGSEVPDFSPKDYVKPKKNIKVMSRDIQMAFVAVAKACQHAGLSIEEGNRSVDPERMGVVFGCDLIALELTELVEAFRLGQVDGKYNFDTWGKLAMEKIMPLWMLKYLPNMPACHIGIALDARGPNNTTTLERCSSLSAITEAARVIQRGDAEVMVCGGCGNKVNPAQLVHARAFNVSTAQRNPDEILRPYDEERTGTIMGEGAAAFVLESREFALARGAEPIATYLGSARTVNPGRKVGADKDAIVAAIRTALKDAGRSPEDISHVNSEGLGSVFDDAQEAAAIREALGDVPVFTGKGHFGNLGSGTGAVELVASLMGQQKGILPAVRNCTKIAADCPINVVIDKPQSIQRPAFIKINHANMGRSVAIVFEKYQS